jgi:hypothetical protein
LKERTRRQSKSRSCPTTSSPCDIKPEAKRRGITNNRETGINREDNERVNIQIKRRGTPLSLILLMKLPKILSHVCGQHSLSTCLSFSYFLLLPLWCIDWNLLSLSFSRLSWSVKKTKQFPETKMCRIQKESKNIFADCLENLLGKLSPSSRCRM